MTSESLYFTLLFILLFLFINPYTMKYSTSLLSQIKIKNDILVSLVLSIVFIFVSWIGFKLVKPCQIQVVDNFRFEVSPCKRRCLWKPYDACSKRCPMEAPRNSDYCCCFKGFTGQPIKRFEYSSDNERGKDCNADCPALEGCGCKPGYASLKYAYDGF